MSVFILGTVAEPVEAFITWLSQKSADPALAKQVASFHAKWGKHYGVRWDFAIFQSCLETGWFTFKGDVKKAQNNFAGIGATGNGEPGESFPTIEIGCKAQIQHLATYAGKTIPDSELEAERTKSNKNWISGKAKTWEELAGRWAEDGSYWRKISAIVTEFSQWYESYPQPKPTLAGKSIAIDVGHGSYKDRDGSGWEPGAVELPVREWNLNVIAAKECAEKLRSLGATVDVFQYDPESPKLTLGEKGARSEEHDVFVSIHHNSSDNPNAQHSLTLIHTNGTAEDSKLAQSIEKQLVAVCKVGDGGVRRQNLGVLSTVPPSVKACCLTEGFFITGRLPEPPDQLAKAEGGAIAQGIADYLVQG
jgi:N-acetylmuramoyl-L-alanine amidase